MRVEDQVYESLFLARAQSFVDPVFIAGKSDADWFADHPVDQIRASVDGHSEAAEFQAGALPLLPELYRVNRSADRLSWRPLIINGVLLPVEFAGRHAPGDTRTRCLADASETVSVQHGMRAGEPRPYYTVSRIALSQGRDNALVRLAQHCTLHHDYSWLVLLRLEQQRRSVFGAARV